MSDVVLSLAANPALRRLAKGVGVHLPPHLTRDTTPYNEPLLTGCHATWLTARGELPPALAGATLGTHEHPAVLVVDATSIRSPTALDTLHETLSPYIGTLAPSGRVVVLAPPLAGDPLQQACSQALEGFTRSLAKELGRRGSTANLLRVAAPDRLEPVLAWLASPRSAFVSGQALTVDGVLRDWTAPGWSQSLAGKTALVTGAARGIGAATAMALAREGAHVVVLDRPEDLDIANDLAHTLDGEALGIDLTAADAPEAIAAALPELDIIVHNAGITRDRTLARMEPGQWAMCLEVNLRALLRVQAALEPKLGSGARVVCLSSIAGLAGNVGQTNYATAKAAVAGWVRAKGPQLAARGIGLNAVAPGFIETRMTAAVPLVTREAGRRLSNLSQGGLPEDVAEVITFLCSPASGGLCGQVLRVCGGSLIGA